MEKQDVVMEQIAVTPYVIEVTEVSKIETVGFCIDITPAYYQCCVRITPYVVQRLLQWLLDENRVTLKGSLTIPIRGRNVNYVK